MNFIRWSRSNGGNAASGNSKKKEFLYLYIIGNNKIWHIFQGHGESAITTSSYEQKPTAVGRGRLLELPGHHSSDASAEATTSSMSKLYIDSKVSSELRQKEFKVTNIPEEDEIIEDVNEDDEKVFRKMGLKG